MQSLLETYDVNEAIAFEQSLPPGDYFVRITLAEPMSVTVQDIREQLVSHGINVYDVKMLAGNQIEIDYHKAEGIGQWQVIIPLIVPLVIVAAVVFGIFKLESITQALIPLILVVGGVVILILAAGGKEPMTEAVKRF